MQQIIQCAIRQSRTGSVYYRVAKAGVTKPSIVRHFSRTPILFKDGYNLPSWVRWYEQDTPNSPVRRDMEDDSEEDEEDNREVTALKAKIAELDKELEELEGAHLSFLTPEERKEIDAAMGDEAFIAEMEQQERNEMSSGEPDLKVQPPSPNAQNVLLRQLTKWLTKAGEERNSFICRKELWRWYIRCKQSIPSSLLSISDASWKVLWQSQYDLDRTGKWRSAHLKILVEDMLKCHRELTVQQRTIYIDCLMKEGRHLEAIEKWQQEEEDIRANEEFAQDFEDLGVRLYSEAGRPKLAQELALSIIKSSVTARARILVPVIASWARGNDGESLKCAWALYIRLRAQMSTHITIEDFDNLSMSFLNLGRTDLALAVFKDLMLADPKSKHDSHELYRKAPGYFDILQSRCDDPKGLMRVSLATLTKLPRRFRNRWFFASWMRRLISKGEVDAASSVVGIMHQRGIMPDPMHLNGIIGAWFRNGTPGNEKKALQTGWAMIQKRLEFVSERRGIIDSGPSLRNLPSHPELKVLPVNTPLYEHHAVPAATIETFSLLLLHYTRSQMWSQIQQLQLAMTSAEIQPNAYFMNHLLYVELRNHDPQSAWGLYKEMSLKTRPDVETFACLWDCQKANLCDIRRAPTQVFPDPRALFSEMMQKITTMNGKSLARAKEEISGEYYHQIIRCFCLANDLQGTVVALHALKGSLGIYPDEAAVRMITIQVSRQDEARPGRTRYRRYQRTRFSDRPDAKSSFLNVVKKLSLLTTERAAELHDRNINLDNVDETFNQNEELWLLTKLLRDEIAKKEPLQGSDIESIERVAWKMGVGGLMIVDPLLPVQVPGEAT